MYKKLFLITPPSLCTEAALHLLRRKKIYEEKSGDAFEAQLAAAAAEPFSAPERAYGCRVREDACAGMRVLVINEDPARPQQPVLLYFHGGGFLYPPGRLQLRMIGVLAKKTGACALLPLYPRLPDGSAAQALERLSAFYAASGYFDGARQVRFVGDSAGGGLALSFAMRLRDGGGRLPGKLLLLSPWLDLTVSAPDVAAREKRDPVLAPWGLRQLGLRWAGCADRLTAPEVSPLYGDVSGLPPILIFVGTHEILLHAARALCEKLDAAQADFLLRTYVGMNHVFPCYLTPEGMLARAQAARFLR